MPSRRLLSPPPSLHHRANRLIPPLAGSLAAAFFCLLILLLLYFRRISRKRTAPSASDTDSKKPPHHLSYLLLCRATSNFSPSLRLGQGGFGSVYRAELKPGRHLSDFPIFTASGHFAVKVMDSGSLQGEREFQNELLFSSKIDCKYTVSVIGFSSNPKKRRMLLVYELMENGSLQDCLFHKKSEELRNWDKRFSIAVNVAKGLEYLHHYCDPPIIHGDIKPSNILLDRNFSAKIGDFGLARFKIEDNGSVVETESAITTSGFDEVVTSSPENVVAVSEPRMSPEVTPMSSLTLVSTNGFEKTGNELEKYVVEWLGNEIRNPRPTRYTIGASLKEKNKKNKKKRGQLDWWASMDNDDKNVKKTQRRAAWEWWKEEYCSELERRRKKKKKKTVKPVQESMSDGYCSENWRSRNNELYVDGLSSTPSMRGTVCYIAPEYCGGGDVSERCDVYSFGVVLLVLVAGRRPLEVTGSPMSEFQRANLLSWARHLGRAGKLEELVDERVECLDKEQALLCITVALLCLQKLPGRRPLMKEVVGILTGDLPLPALPLEFSLASGWKSRKKVR